ncbi:MAG: ThuA domain-containing protein [Clostridia bacterium]|nr:ThuA domain-containing protein [Clostridia bacterium]
MLNDWKDPRGKESQKEMKRRLAGEGNDEMEKKLKVAVITEWHPIDVIAFQKMFERFDEFECYIQSLELFVADDKNRDVYDAVVYYNLSMPLLEEDSKTYRYFTEEMGGGQGIILLHHAILCYNGWDLWSELSGVPDRNFTYHWDQTLDFHIEKPDHPIVSGVSGWRMTDESYRFDEKTNLGNEVLITAEHPLSVNGIAWTRNFKKSRVFCYASGHDDSAYQNDSFQKVLRNGILWCARR